MTRAQLILRYINKLEEWAGESWMDYYGDDFIFLNISFLLGYWSVRYPDLFEYLMKESSNNIPWEYPQDGLVDLVEFFYYPDQYTETGAHRFVFDEDKYDLTRIPWISIIDENKVYFDRFINRAERDFLKTSYDDMHSEQQYLCDLLKEIKNYVNI